MTNASLAPLELWAAPECSIVRVGEDYRNQIEETGHGARLDDIAAVAALGVRTMRYPLLWETIRPELGGPCDWSWTDERLAAIRGLGMSPIAGLLHHGSGPRHTSLLDPRFPKLLAEHAALAAERYPWIECWTPVNEPLTTARFSCLYGHWYPHRRSPEDFLRATVNQCHAVLLSMRAIRARIPHAKLVQTEDLGRTFSTRSLAHQARYENDRRWLSLDLLTGRVDDSHRFYGALIKAGVDPDSLADLAGGEACPDIVGINHYLTSDRFLDERTKLYPHLTVGGNGRRDYVDTEAVRIAKPGGSLGMASRLHEAWERYRLPLAVTEAHNGCTREEQLRWLCEAWQGAESARQAGADVRAVTVWALFGAVDWCSLLTRRNGAVEHGPLDTRGGKLRRTLVAQAAAALATERTFEHPVLETPGWWRRPDRVFETVRPALQPGQDILAGRPILVTGASGTLGRAFGRICQARGLAHVVTARSDLDLNDSDSIRRSLDRHRPWAVINAAGFVRVAEAEAEPEHCFQANSEGPARLAVACSVLGLPFLSFSSDLVFDGAAGRPYTEADALCPTTVYGESKRRAEALVGEAHHGSLIIRTSAFFGPWDRHNFVWQSLARLSRGEVVVASARQLVSPTYVPDLVSASLDLLLDGETGVWHLANPGEVSWRDLAREAAHRAGLDGTLVVAANDDSLRNNALGSGRAVLLRPLERALDTYFTASEMPWAA
jgi:dTDP-4-dehydrorhamnose reductase